MKVLLSITLFSVLYGHYSGTSFQIRPDDEECISTGVCSAVNKPEIDVQPASNSIGGMPDTLSDFRPAAHLPVGAPYGRVQETRRNVRPFNCHPACEPPFVCQIGNRCAVPADDLTEHDIPPEACMAEGFECRNNEVCAETSSMGKQCIEAQTLGGTCATSELLLCSAGLGCLAGRCVALISEGSTCDPSSSTAVCAGIQSGVVCAGHAGSTMCMHPVGLGHPCGKASSRGWVCGKGFMCTGGTCKKRVRVGQSCDSAVTECPRGTLCAPGKIGRRCVRLASNSREEASGSWVIFSSRSPSVLYWNGARVADNFGSGEYTAARVHLEMGDVLAFRVFRLLNDTDESDTLLWNGLIAAVVGKLHGAATGAEQVANWVARTGEDIEGSGVRLHRQARHKFWYWRARITEQGEKNTSDWLLPSYEDGFCGDGPAQDGTEWGELDGVDLQGTADGYARYFPSWTGATYAMADGADVYDEMLFRVRFGIPHCT